MRYGAHVNESILYLDHCIFSEMTNSVFDSVSINHNVAVEAICSNHHRRRSVDSDSCRAWQRIASPEHNCVRGVFVWSHVTLCYAFLCYCPGIPCDYSRVKT
jgi:hypothetical protein